MDIFLTNDSTFNCLVGKLNMLHSIQRKWKTQNLQYSTARRTHEGTYRHVDIGRPPLTTVEAFFIMWQGAKISKDF